MCKQLGISHAAYYKWLHRTIPEQESENTKLAELIKEYDERFCQFCVLGFLLWNCPVQPFIVSSV